MRGRRGDERSWRISGAGIACETAGIPKIFGRLAKTRDG